MTRGEGSTRKDLRNLEKVRGIFVSLSKYINAKTIYSSNNPNVSNFANALYQAFRTFFEDEKELLLSIEQYRIRWNGEVVYDNQEKTNSIAFLLFKDGVGEITFQSSLTPAELERFVDLLKNEIYTPSAHLDIVSRLWQSEFTAISYRVFDECADGAAGDGRGAGSASPEQPLQASDHPQFPFSGAAADGRAVPTGDRVDPLGAYLENLLERTHPGATPGEKERHLQDLMVHLFTSSTEDLTSWRNDRARMIDENKLLHLLAIMLDFAQMRSAPPVVRDISDIIDRLVRYIVEEAHVPTLIALLEIQRTICRERAFAVEFQSLPSRIEHEITNSAFLLSLGKIRGRSSTDVCEVLRYFRMIGRNAVPGICELLATLKEPSLHKDACDTLIGIAAEDIPRIVNDLNLDNPHEAKDAIYLLRQTTKNEVHPVVKKLMTSPDLHVREQVIEHLVHVGNDEAANLLCALLEDHDPNVRMKTFAAVEELKHPLVVGKVTDLCFAEDDAAKSADELDRMFRAVGKLGGDKVLESIGQMIHRGSWLRLGRSRGKQNKLLAITALRHIPGGQSLEMLRSLARDGDSLVKTKALFVLKQLEQSKNPHAAELTPVSGKDVGP